MVPEILYVEDNFDIREITTLLLNKAGYSITPASNGQEALRIFSQRNFDLIITDIFMPEMDGNEFIRRLAELGCFTPILVLTYSFSDIDPNSIISGIATKPFTFEDLRNTVSQMIALRWGIHGLTQAAY